MLRNKWPLTAGVMTVLAMDCGVIFAAVFEGLGDFPGGGFQSRALAISTDGRTVVGHGSPNGPVEPFAWTREGGMRRLHGASGYRAVDVSADGSVIVLDGSGPPARWTQSSGPVELPFLPNHHFGEALGISDDGSTIVGWTRDANLEATFWTASNSVVGIGHLPGGRFTSKSWAVSADGSVIVGSSASDPSGFGIKAFRWTQDTGMVALPNMPAAVTPHTALDVTPDGSVVVGFGSGSRRTEAFRWENGQTVGLGDLPGDEFKSVANAVSDDGSVIVGTSNFFLPLGFDGQAFVWDAQHGMRDLKMVLEGDYGLDLAGWTLAQATDVSGDGLIIVGHGFNPNGDREAWIAIIPEPGTMSLLTLGVLGLATHRRGYACDERRSI